MGLAIAAVLSGSEVDPCCCPTDCCLYPWPDPDGTPLYPATDLPDSVLINSLSVSRVGYTYPYSDAGTDFTLQASVDTFGNPATSWNVIRDDGTPIPESDIGPCLIVNTPSFNVEDEFADTYTITFLGVDVEATRVSLCQWEGTDECGNVWKFWYGDNGAEGGTDYKWNGKVYSFDEDCVSEEFSICTKDDPQNSPAGTYTGPATFTVA